MAPRKEKAEKASADQGKLIIAVHPPFKFSASANAVPHSGGSDITVPSRPYSATDISANLKNKVTKAAAAKHLKDLHEKKEIEGRVSGKQVVYHAIQEPTDPSNDAIITNLDATLADLRTETGSLSTQLRNLKTQLSALSTSLTTSQLHESIAALSTEQAALEVRLAPLRTGVEKPPLSKEEKETLVKREKYWKITCERRAKIKKELWGMVREGLPEGLKEADVAEQLGIED